MQRPNETCYYYLTAHLFIDSRVAVARSRNAEGIIAAVVENNWNKLWDVLDEKALVGKKNIYTKIHTHRRTFRHSCSLYAFFFLIDHSY